MYTKILRQRRINLGKDGHFYTTLSFIINENEINIFLGEV